MSEEKKAVITVVGKDRAGIIAEVSRILFQENVNILDISQTIMNEFFTMIMIVDLLEMTEPMDGLRMRLVEAGTALGVSVTLQDSRVFEAMHRL